jgi:hypothetical protein
MHKGCTSTVRLVACLSITVAQSAVARNRLASRQALVSTNFFARRAEYAFMEDQRIADTYHSLLRGKWANVSPFVRLIADGQYHGPAPPEYPVRPVAVLHAQHAPTCLTRQSICPLPTRKPQQRPSSTGVRPHHRREQLCLIVTNAVGKCIDLDLLELLYYTSADC